MRVTLSWTAAMGRLCKHISEIIEETGKVSYGDLAWLKALARFRGSITGLPGGGPPSSEDKDRIALMFDASGLAGVLLGEHHFPALEERRIESIRLIDDQWSGATRDDQWSGPSDAGFSGESELVMGCPSYPKNWRH